jgi:hypothetical protein
MTICVHSQSKELLDLVGAIYVAFLYSDGIQDLFREKYNIQEYQEEEEEEDEDEKEIEEEIEEEKSKTIKKKIKQSGGKPLADYTDDEINKMTILKSEEERENFRKARDEALQEKIKKLNKSAKKDLKDYKDKIRYSTPTIDSYNESVGYIGNNVNEFTNMGNTGIRYLRSMKDIPVVGDIVRENEMYDKMIENAEEVTDKLNKVDKLQNKAKLGVTTIDMVKNAPKRAADGIQNTKKALLNTPENLKKAKDAITKIPGVTAIVSNPIGQASLAATVGVLALNKIHKSLQKRKYMKNLLKEDDEYYSCSMSKCKQLEYLMKTTIINFLKENKYEKNVLYMTTDENNKNLYFDKMNFEIYAGIPENNLKIFPEIETKMRELINRHQSKWTQKEINTFHKKKAFDKLFQLDVIPSYPTIILVSYNYSPYTRADSIRDYKEQQKYLRYEGGLKKIIKYHGNNYKITSMIMGNFNKDKGDILAAGVTCNNKKYMFIGSGNNAEKKTIGPSCMLIPFKWFDAKKPFCMNEMLCNVDHEDLENNVNEQFCFNKETGTRFFIYVRES